MVTLTTKLVDGPQPYLEIDEAELHVSAGPDKGATLKLDTQTITIGSAPDCALVLHDSTVSSRHAEIRGAGQGYAIHDLDSTNGIYVGSTRILAAPLCGGLKIRLGESVLAVRALGSRRRVKLWRETQPSETGAFGALVTRSVPMRAATFMLAQLAEADTTVLLEGATGTGKEVAALALHRASARKDAPFVVVDCGALQSQLAAAELFGVERGAFTGAGASRRGLLEEAEGGTLFLDEIGELPLDIQSSLLGVLERRASRRVGGTAERQHDLRIVAATNRNLAEEVRAGHFRQDLYFRLAIARVPIPRLRERPEDLPILADAFASELGITLSREVVATFLAYDWPGNIRELRNTIERMAAAPSAPLELVPASSDPVFDARGGVRPLPEARRAAGETFERDYIARVLTVAEGSTARAAELAGISSRLMRQLISKHRLRPDSDD
jgi:DNA-binding NtrC family response regulator